MSNTTTPNINSVIINDREITIRPIQHGDTILEESFIENLSERAKHYRFLGGVSRLSANEIQHLCDVDYHDSMAFIAVVDDGGKEREIGVARYAKDAGTQSREMAITIADDFRDTNLGQVLVEQLKAYGKQHGVKTIYSMDLNDNTDMRKLANDLNMSVKRDPNDIHQVIYL